MVRNFIKIGTKIGKNCPIIIKIGIDVEITAKSLKRKSSKKFWNSSQKSLKLWKKLSNTMKIVENAVKFQFKKVLKNHENF